MFVGGWMSEERERKRGKEGKDLNSNEWRIKWKVLFFRVEWKSRTFFSKLDYWTARKFKARSKTDHKSCLNEPLPPPPPPIQPPPQNLRLLSEIEATCFVSKSFHSIFFREEEKNSAAREMASVWLSKKISYPSKTLWLLWTGKHYFEWLALMFYSQTLSRDIFLLIPSPSLPLSLEAKGTFSGPRGVLS